MAWFTKRSARQRPENGGVLSAAEADALGVETLIAQGLSTIQTTTNVYSDLFGIDRADWSVDLPAGEIKFTTTDRAAVGQVQVIGTMDPAAGTWMWGWDHPSVPAASAVAAGRVRDFGARNGLPELTTRVVEATEAEAWRFTQLAVRLGDDTCAYRGNAGGPLVFMAFGAVSVTRR